MRRSAPALCVALLATSCNVEPVNPCDKQGGACLDVDVQGDVGPVAEVRLDLSGAATHTTISKPAGPPAPLPLAVGIILPASTAGKIDIRGMALRGGLPIGYGEASVTVKAGAKSRVVMQMVRSNGDLDDDGDPDINDCNPRDKKIHHPVIDPGSPKYDPFPESPNCCGYSLGKSLGDLAKPFNDDPTCHPGTCGNGVDENCDGSDVACQTDNDCDRFLAGEPSAGSDCKATAAPGGTDCNDCDPTVSPQASESCGDSKDNNCNGLVDETCLACDLDGDGYQRLDAAYNCPDSAYKASNKPVDCNDEDAGVFPGSTLVPIRVGAVPPNCGGKEGGTLACALRAACRAKNPDGTAQDADCNGKVEGCPDPSCDADGDGFVAEAMASLCDPMNATPLHDCDDRDPTTFPGAPNECQKVHDCTTTMASGCTIDSGRLDADGDGWDATVDCNDNAVTIHPWATEVCNGVDDDCDGLVDEGNPDATGAPMVQDKHVLYCNNSNYGICKPLTGHCVCSSVSLKNQGFNQQDRARCPGETGAIDTGDKAGITAPRCYGAIQPRPQSCDPLNPADDDCDGRFDAPDGKSLAVLGMSCLPAGAQGRCGATAPKVIGCDMSRVSCFAGLGGNPWHVCDSTATCPTAEKCNGFDDDCDGALPGDEQDQDSDGYMACGSSAPLYNQSGAVCEKVANNNLKCGDCADAAGSTQGVSHVLIHPGASDLCDGLDNNCDDLARDGEDECGVGGQAPTCCSTARACVDTTNTSAHCGACDSPCNPVKANLCLNSSCSCGMSGQPCGSGLFCNNGVCAQCQDTLHCGPSCTACTGATPLCDQAAGKCIGCLSNADCGGYLCDTGTRLCTTTCDPADASTCSDGYYCAPDKTCRPKKLNGSSCTSAPECLSNYCTMGQNGLLCSYVPSCPLCQVVDPSGTSCVPAAPNTDPKLDCANAQICHFPYCNGQGACTPNNEGQRCGWRCVNGRWDANQGKVVQSEETELFCDSGACVPGAVTHTCELGLTCDTKKEKCLTTCNADPQDSLDGPGSGCIEDYYCPADHGDCSDGPTASLGYCCPKGAAGAGCYAPAECLSNNCCCYQCQ